MCGVLSGDMALAGRGRWKLFEFHWHLALGAAAANIKDRLMFVERRKDRMRRHHQREMMMSLEMMLLSSSQRRRRE